MSLRVLCAGSPREEVETTEADVRRALGPRVDRADWTVSVVKVAHRLSVTLDAPADGVRALTLVAPEGRLREEIARALRTGPDDAAAPGPPAQTERQARQTCPCGGAFVVIYDGSPDEDEELAAVACPHCWKTTQVLIGAGAAATRDYRAEKA